MKHYIEMTLMKNDDFSPYELWSRIYTQLHIALAEIKDANDKVNIGLSFPQYRFNEEKGIGFLGEKIRLFAESESILKSIYLRKWLETSYDKVDLTDYVHIKSISEVPEKKITGYSIYSRIQVKSNAERLARHDEKKGRYSYENALEHYKKFVKNTDLPYIQMLSLSTSNERDKKRFKLFIRKQSAEKSETQVFSTYGLSSVSSVPEF
ncbi:type I-F CRISPR-associated endoribonuclease Cas6/Csy4 [Acinetobacter sichuanensis]|uniref:Type I-F CRISPR-associated endoribonuclease Cas6/Csy4 n=1 Tax=Acinetobacter sichuanensis TaxID=2136183 RepID=A0A371YKQ6_9GAMM|nr:type I-F CRISPR-associated endoribonuclease Cas6/Csy4 [Acinetobacter sichuanensis]RFC82063.1 type I-F CRISPR-associated endoribonuclease Cas6/Csy4 [Acinetobacter sichuanensis]